MTPRKTDAGHRELVSHVRIGVDSQVWIDALIIPALLKEYLVFQADAERGTLDLSDDELAYARGDSGMGGLS